MCNTIEENGPAHKNKTKHQYRLLTQEEKQAKLEQRGARQRGAAALAEHAGVARIAQASVVVVGPLKRFSDKNPPLLNTWVTVCPSPGQRTKRDRP